MDDTEESTPEVQILTFLIGGDEYGVNITDVKEIIEYAPTTKIPSSPVFMKGVLNLRGSVVPVIDLALKFGLAESPVTKRTCIVIAEIDHEGKKGLLGVVVDRVNQVMDILPEEVEPPPSFGTPVHPEFVKGLAKREKSFILILALDKILSLEELRVGASVLESGK